MIAKNNPSLTLNHQSDHVWTPNLLATEAPSLRLYTVMNTGKQDRKEAYWNSNTSFLELQEPFSYCEITSELVSHSQTFRLTAEGLE